MVKSFPIQKLIIFFSEIAKLPPYPDVKPGLEQLKNEGYKLIVFSKGKPDILNSQLEFAGIESYFDGIHSVEEIKKNKPHPKSYKHIPNKYGEQ